MTDPKPGLNMLYFPKCKMRDFGPVWPFSDNLFAAKPSTIHAIFLLLDEVLTFVVSVQGGVPQLLVGPINQTYPNILRK